VVVVGGVLIMALRLGFQERDEELAMMHHVRANLSPGDVYLLPVRLPKLPGSRGSFKSDFIPLPDLADPKFIPLDLQRFRLVTGAPIFVDFKSIPYWDQDLLEWFDRLQVAEQVNNQLKAGHVKQALPTLRACGITHIVQQAGDKRLESPALI